MGDFISNNPGGKSDLFSPPPPKEPPHQESFIDKEETIGNDHTEPDGNASSNENSSFSNTNISHDEYTQNPSSGSWQSSGQGQYQGTYAYDPVYQQAVYGNPPPPENKNSGLNTASLVLGIVSCGGLILCCGCFSPITAILSIIFACIGRENGKFNGKGLAGFILSIVCLGLMLLLFSLVMASGANEWSAITEDVMADSILTTIQMIL